MRISANAAQARLTKQRLARPEDQLSYELGKAVQELPPLYTRLLAGTISLLVFSTIAWSYLSQVDEVATAPGELIASTQVRPVRSLGEGTIRVIKVKEGDRITKGQVIIERDPTLQQTDVDRLAQSAELIQQDLQRLNAERIGKTTTENQLQNQLLVSRLRDFEARQAAATAEAKRQGALYEQAKVRLTRLQENLVNAKTSVTNFKTNLMNAQKLRDNAQSNLAKVESSVAIAKETAKRLTTLSKDGAVAELRALQAQDDVNKANVELSRIRAEITRATDEVTTTQSKITEAQDRVVSLEKDIAAQREEIRQAEQGYQAARQQAKRVTSERQSEILTELNKRQEELTNVSGQLKQAQQQRERENITAPVSGTIYSVKATKGPVQAGEELLSILPDGEDLLLEVKVLNRDIGFIREGMSAKVKLATFPFQEFGTIPGTVVQVSPNAIADKDLGLVFPTRIKLEKHAVMVRGKEVKFTPGMSASGEIVTGKKRVFDYILDPIRKKVNEAFSER